MDAIAQYQCVKANYPLTKQARFVLIFKLQEDLYGESVEACNKTVYFANDKLLTTAVIVHF